MSNPYITYYLYSYIHTLFIYMLGYMQLLCLHLTYLLGKIYWSNFILYNYFIFYFIFTYNYASGIARGIQGFGKTSGTISGDVQGCRNKK